MAAGKEPMAPAQDAGWEPPYSLEEKLKYRLVPGALYLHYRAWKEWVKGEPEIRLLRYLVDPARNSVDVGANKGVYTYFLARRSRQVFAFEPNPKIFRILARNTRTAPNVTLSRLALSNESQAAVLRVPRHRGGFSNQGASLSALKVPSDYKEVRIEAARLDDLEISDAGFIKIDVEGFEQEVLDGASLLLERDRPVLLIEIEERFLNRPIEAAIRSVQDLGYRGVALLDGRLIDLARFDGDRHQRTPGRRTEYLNNFIFLPR